MKRQIAFKLEDKVLYLIYHNGRSYTPRALIAFNFWWQWEKPWFGHTVDSLASVITLGWTFTPIFLIIFTVIELD